jgi:hypothetical protein
MNLFQYVSGLLPSFSKNAVLTSAEITKTSIREHTLPAYDTAVELWKGTKFKAKTVQVIESEIKKGVSPKPLFEVVQKALSNGCLILEFAGDHSKKIFSNTEANVGLTYAKATLVRVVGASEFANTYARKLINYIYIEEAIQAGVEQHVVMPPVEVKWLHDSVNDFCIALRALTRNVEDFKKHVNGLPDAVISELTEATFSTTIGEAKTDPFELRNLSVKVSPFYLVGMWMASYQANKYKAAQAELELLQLRQLQLQKTLERTQDAKLEKELEYLQDRVNGLNYSLQKMEKNYHV